MAKKYFFSYLIFLFVAILFASAGRAYSQCPVVPAFSFSKACTQDFRISFTNGSSVTPPAAIDYYRWEFGDGISSTATNPSHTYPSSGTYQVILFVYDISGCYDSVFQNVLATALPQASYTYTQTGCGKITFTNTSTYEGATPAFFWSFGDGQISTDENPVHTYVAGQTSNVSLTVTDDYGCSDTYVYAIAIFPPATVDFTYFINMCEDVQFFENVTGTGMISYLWNFGDGFTSTASNPMHTYVLGATYYVTLTISDQYCSGLTYTDSVVLPLAPSASFTFSPDGQCASTPIDFDASGSTGFNLNYNWDFGDGTFATGLFLPDTQYLYNSYNNATCDPGQSYSVELVVSDGIGCTDTAFDIVNTQRVPQPLLQDISGNNFQNCYSVNPADPTDTIWVDNLTPNMTCITHLDIDWGDGSDTLNLNAGDFPLMHIYLSMGEFPLTVTAYGTNGCVSDTTYVVANQVNPSIGISSSSANAGCAPFIARFVLQGYTGNSNATTYIWDFDDSTTVTWDYNQPYINDTIEHVYTQSHCSNPNASSPDGYSPSVTAVNECGTWTSTIQYITIFETPIAAFSSVDSTNYGCFSEQICFTNYTSHGFTANCDSSVNFTWDFGDGNFSSDDEPCHTYAYPGTYQVNLLADNPFCGGTDTTIAIHIAGTHADFTFDTACVSNETHFTNFSWAYDDSSFLSNPLILITSYLWDFGDGDSDSVQHPNHIYPDTGTYNVCLTVSNQYGCDSTICKDIYVDGIFVENVVVDSITCYNADNGSITVNVTGGIPIITYTLNPGSITNTNGTFNGLAPGAYWILAEDAMGCWDETDTVYLFEPDPISIDSVQFTDITCNNYNDGTITAFASGGTNPFSYTLIPPGTNNTAGIFTGLAGGAYRVVVDDANGCLADTSAFINISNPPSVIIDSVQSMDITCHNADDGSIQVWAQGGTGTISYTLNPGGTTNITGIFTALSGGTYYVVVSDDNMCDDTTANIDIINPAGIIISSAVATDMSCHDTLDGSITVVASGGTGILTYTLLPSFSINTNGIFTGIGAGSYYVRIEDANGCADSTVTLIIANPDVIQITSEVFSDITCHNDNNGSITVTATGGTPALSYTLMPLMITNGTGVFNSLMAGTYRVLVDDANACSADTSSFITIVNPPELLIDSIQSMGISCFNANDGWIQAYASGGNGLLTYTLKPGAVVNNTGLYTSLSGGIYTVTVEDANACMLTSGNIDIINPSSVQIAGFTFTNMSCHDTLDGSITVSAVGGTGVTTFTLQPSGTTNFTGIFTGLGAGTYYVRAEDGNGCDDSTANIVILNPDEILITSESFTQITCYNADDGIVEVTASGGNTPYTFYLLPSAISNATGQFTNLAAGTYFIVVEDANGCPSDTSNPLIIINPPELLIDSTHYFDITCNGYNNGWIEAFASGGTGTLSYTLNPVGTINNTGYFNGLSAGNYTVTVTDSNSCIAVSLGIVIAEPSAISSSAVHTDVSCYGFDNGTITITASGGVLPLDYSIDNGFSYFPFSNFSGLTPGSYFARVRDANGCETTGIPIIILEPLMLQITGFTPVTPSCAGCSDGMLTANVIGGTLPYFHNWSNGMSGNPITGIPAGWYTDTVTDANGCQVIDSVFLDEPGPLAIVLDSANAVCYGGSTGWVAVIASGGTTPYTYEWTKLPSPTVIGTNDTLFNADAGFYAVTVYDFFSNFIQDTIEVGQPDTLALSFAFSDTICFGASNGWATVNVIGGFPPYSYSWSGGAGAATDSIYNLTAGTYTVTVTDQNNCETIDGVTIIENQELFVNATANTMLLCAGDSTQLNATVTGGTLPVMSYQWTPATGLNDPAIQSPMAMPMTSTVYTVVITDQRGCIALDSVSIDAVPSPTADFNCQNPCASNIVNFLNLSNANGDTIVLYSWDFGDGYFSNLQHPTHTYGAVDTTYTVSLIVQNSNGCSDTIVQGVYVNPLLGLIVEADTACVGYPTQFNDTVTNPITPIISYFYDFGDGNTASVSDPTHQYALAGIYNVSVTIEDTSGCVEATNINVRVHALPLPDFSDSTSCFNNITYFTDLTDVSVSGINSWFWDFGDGNTSIQQHPTHLYTIEGTYQVSLTIENTNGCLNSVSMPVSVFPRPRAAFITDTVCLGNPSSFVDLSTASFGVINSWYWDFGDGNFSTQQFPVHVYSTPGFYNVALIIGSSTGCSDTLIQVAGVDPLPTANFSYTSPCEFSQTSFTDLSAANATSITAWYWDFGDGYTSNLQNPQHIFPSGGTYMVNLTVTNSNGCVDDTTMNVIVASAPTASFTYNLSSCVNDTTYFTDQSLPIVGFITSWEWDFGDGNTSIIQHPRHVYTSSGLFTVSLAVTNSLGCVDTSMQSLVVYPEPVADFSYGSGCMNVPAFFYDQSSTSNGQIASWEWDFGDPGSGAANQSTLQNPSHIYVFAGLYNVMLIVTNTNSCVDTIIQQIEVRPNPTVAFDFDLVCDDDTTVFLDQSLPATAPFGQWHWDFGDGNSTTYNTFTDSVFHVYNNPGQYHVTLTVTDTMGCSGLQVRMLTIYAKPTALFAYHKSCVNNLTHFTDHSNGSGADIVSWYWDFGDPASGVLNNSTLQHPTHQYGVAGDYFVTLWVTNAEGCENQTTQTITVTPGPVADFEADSSCVGFITFFNNLSYAIGENIISWHWDFGDGTSSILQFPSHAYISAGTYWVSLTVETENGCVDNIVKPVTIYELPVPDFNYTIPNCFGDSTYFYDLSWFYGGNIITAWHWDFGDGWTNTTDQNPVHEYALPGHYSVTLTVYDTNGCYATHSENLSVFEGPDADFNATVVCMGQPSLFTDLSTTTGLPITEWFWDFGDGNTSVLQNPFHIYAASGLYTVTLTVTDLGGCDDIAMGTVEVYETPTAMFIADSVCAGHETNFTDLSIPAANITSWYWDFGDLSSGFYNFSFLQNPTHIYALEGTYLVNLTVTDFDGCSHTVEQEIWVEPEPFANFSFTNEHCVGESVLFMDLSGTPTEIIIMWVWDFGDGTRDTIHHPANPNIEHTYLNPGQHLVMLTVTNVHGCVGSTSKPINILPAPLAYFDYSSACEDQIVHFNDVTNQNGGGQVINWDWNFDDPLSGATNTSQLQNPEHLFSGPGFYDVSLIVWNANSCRDTVVLTVQVLEKPAMDFYNDASCEDELTQFYVDDVVTNINTITSYLWDFGDGGYSNLSDPVHLFAGPGIFNVSLTVTDTSLCENTIIKEVTVDENPVAFFDITEPTCNTDSVFFDDLSSTTWGYIQTWVWDFDDGSPIDSIHFPDDPNVFHTYIAPGTYGATLTVINSQGCSHTYMREVDILAKPIANFQWSANPCQNEEVEFTDASFPNGQGNILSWYWEFDDPMSGINNTSVMQNPVHIFSEGGLYNVLLIVVNFNDCVDTIVKPISVNESPDVAFLWDYACEDTLTYFWPDSSIMNPSAVIGWNWDFGDGQFSTEPSPAHYYENAGYYNVTLTIQDTGVCTNMHIEEIFVNAKPDAFFDVSEITCMGNPMYFDDLSSVPNSYIVEWHWDFGDGNDTTIFFPDEPDVWYSYAIDGTYPVTLTVTSADSCYGDEMLYVVIDAAPIALFDFDQSCYGIPTQFYDNSSGGGGLTITSWLWDFGDPSSGVNNTSTLQDPEHIYTAPGLYNVMLTITNVGGCIDTIVQEIQVNDGAPVDFYAENSCLNFNTYFFIDPLVTDTNAIILYDWEFGDNSTHSSAMNPAHLYSNAGIFNVTLVITDTSGCSNMVMHETEVRDNPVALFEYEAACANDTAYFTDLSYTLNGDLVIAWEWDFGDPASGANNYSAKQNPVHVYTGQQNYYVNLIVTTDHGCRGSIMIPLAVTSNPVSNFSYNSDFCDPGLVFFTDSSTYTQSVITEWEWYMEPGSYSYIPDPYHIFLLTDTTYNIRLTVTDANGCSDEIVKPVFVPAAFEVEIVCNPTCHLEPMDFSVNLLSPIPDSIFSYSWNFGEPASGPNNTSIYPTPDHTYQSPGYYTVALTAVDIHGCETIVYKQVLVKMLPEAAFEYANTLCDSTLYFTDLSSGSGANITSWLWDYGDGSPSQLITTVIGNTEHFYEDDGVYTVHLTVTNENGCVNFTSMEVERKPCLNADFFVVNEAICERNTITFADSSTIDYLIDIWQWDFGDGTDTLYDIKSDTVNHYYETAGDYNVTLVVYAMFNSEVVADTFTNIVKVRPTPIPDFICNPVCFGDASQLNDETEHPGSFIDSWHWNFGTGDPGDTSIHKNCVFKYDSAGNYNVELITINQFGCMDSVRRDVRVNYLPLADYEYSVACEGEQIYFTDLSDGFDADIVAWNWDFNDPLLSGDQSSEQHPYWKYEHQGTNTVRLIINNENGCADTVEYDVKVNNVPRADFTLFNNYNNIQGSILLEDQSIDALDYLWDFGDGYELWDDYPPIIHIYEEDGEYVVRLIVWNEYGCPDTTLMDYKFMFNTLFIPNALAPASNDPEVKVFQPKGRNLDEFYIAIHDSWGNILWESDKLDKDGRPAESWDGTYNGTLLPTDVYIWRARAVFKDGTFWEGNVVGNNEGGSGTTSGTVTLVR